MSKWILYILMTALVTGCITRIDQPQPDIWEYYYKHKKGDTPFEVIKKDMLACGFDSTRTGYIEGDDEHDTQYINASLCMESKGYRKESIKEPTVCLNPAYKEEPACQKYLGEKHLGK
ncbi:hypothetical protein [Psychrobacter sp. FDAARGOS_221]|uniref:hypothetical protein n=1 Tax=Psychrobacter sp. FDAARGOS_221 TaxID=1975705 RepID=UPI000BB56E94|nr:hypothetical protein [Psychrobacter sp. FDAARGOS_221]PNK61314.1 hypothetical protein A6J60_010840 [Psychrobacter sp. FDAARGOS_221]